jgi:ComF family protein
MNRLPPLTTSQMPQHGLFNWRQRWRGFNRWPTSCLVCHSWQHAPLCEPCQMAFAPQSRRCPRCALPLPGTHPAHEACALCEDHSPEFDRAVAAIDYVAPWSPLIARLKFNQASALARPLGKLLAQAVRQRGGIPRGLLVLAAPLSTSRLRERGYNQADLLAREVARELQLEFRADAIIKHRHTARMMSLSTEERAAQIQGAYEVHAQQAGSLIGQNVAVVDDVMTTGATLNEISLTLREAGARSVSAWVLARTPPPERREPHADEPILKG